MMKLDTLLLAVLASAALVACGGGDDSGTTPVVQTANSFESMAGNYSSGCLPSDYEKTSKIFNLVVTPVTGTANATVSVHATGYTSIDCNTSTVNMDLTGQGEITELSQTKVITGVGSTRAGTAHAVEFKYTGLTIAKGIFNITVPTLGATAKVGYLMEGNKLYGLVGSRGSDGLQERFSSTVLIKQ
jgi:hypothetical protein